MSSIAKQIFATFLDGTIQNLLYQLLSRSVIGSVPSSSLEVWKDDIKAVIELLYVVMSLEINYFKDLLSNIWTTSRIASGTPAMTILGLQWREKGSTAVYVLLYILNFTVMKLHKLSLSSGLKVTSYSFRKLVSTSIYDFFVLLLTIMVFHVGWKQDISYIKRQMAEAIRISIIAAKTLSIISFLFLVTQADNAPTLLLRLSGYRMGPLSTIPTSNNSIVNYRPSQLFLEQRKFMWMSMIGLASAAMVSIDWQYLNTTAQQKYQSFLKFMKSISAYLRQKLMSSAQISGTTDNNTTANDYRVDSEEGDVHDSYKCVRCSKIPPENPHRSVACRHVFCYLCIAPYVSQSSNSISADTNEQNDEQKHTCPVCNKVIDHMIPCENDTI